MPAFAWLAAAAIVATAVPAFVRLPYNVPGLQSLTPQKILVPLVILALAWHQWRRRRWPHLTPAACAAGGLFLWLLLSVVVNREYQFTYNVRAWSWLAVYFGLLVAVQEMAARGPSRRLLARSVLLAVAMVALIGFIELLDLRAMDRFFLLFRPNWLGLGLRGPGGPDTVLPLHAITGGQMRLMSTLSNDAGWFLALGAVGLAGLWLFGDRQRPWPARGMPVLVAAAYAVVLLALLLTLSRASILAALVGLAGLAGAASRLSSRLRRRALAIAALTVLLIAVQTQSSSVLRTKFSGLASGRAWTTGMVASETRVIPSDEQAARTPIAGQPAQTAVPAGPPAPASPPPTSPASPPAPRPAAASAAAEAGTRSPPEAASATPSPGPSPAGAKGDASSYGAWSVTQRVLMWRVAVVMVWHHPIFGVGFANFRTRLYEPGEYFDLFEVGDRVGDVQDPHNFFLWIASAGGLPALILIVLVLGLSARTIAREVSGGGAESGLALTLGAIWLTLLVFMGMGFTLMTPATQAVFALLVGTTAALGSGQQARQPSVAQDNGQA